MLVLWMWALVENLKLLILIFLKEVSQTNYQNIIRNVYDLNWWSDEFSQHYEHTRTHKHTYFIKIFESRHSLLWTLFEINDLLGTSITREEEGEDGNTMESILFCHHVPYFVCVCVFVSLSCRHSLACFAMLFLFYYYYYFAFL